jgi:hypothetical protein
MSITVIVLTNRKNRYLPTVLDAFHEHVTGWDDLIFVDDSGDHAWRMSLAEDTGRLVFPVGDAPSGYTKAMQAVLEVARGQAGPVFLLEEDWLILQDVDLRDLAATLAADSNLAQVRLARGPFFKVEKRRGVAATWWPSMWTCNPSLIASSTFDTDWPIGLWSEEAFGHALLEKGATFAVHGDEKHPIVEHIGLDRADTSGGY